MRGICVGKESFRSLLFFFFWKGGRAGGGGEIIVLMKTALVLPIAYVAVVVFVVFLWLGWAICSGSFFCLHAPIIYVV